MAKGKATYEGSPADERKDSVAAKKAGMTRGQFEKSAQDKRMDAAGQRKLNHPPSTPLEKNMVGTMKKYNLSKLTAAPNRKR